MRVPLALAALLLVSPAMAAGGSCQKISLDDKPPPKLSGMLSFKVFPGAPNFTDVRSGDQPEPSYVLTLDGAVCATGGDFGSERSQPIDAVHLTQPFDGSMPQVMNALRSAKGRHVEVTISSLDAATTGHHHAPLLAEVVSLSLDGQGIPGMEQPGTTTVRGFYDALSAGDGAEAAKFVVPELRVRGPLSPAAMSAYYSTLPSPLRLRDVRPLGPEVFEATYAFTARSGACDGRSIVTTRQMGSLILIAGIHSLSGC